MQRALALNPHVCLKHHGRVRAVDHVVGTYDGSLARLFWNGVEAACLVVGLLAQGAWQAATPWFFKVDNRSVSYLDGLRLKQLWPCSCRSTHNEGSTFPLARLLIAADGNMTSTDSRTLPALVRVARGLLSGQHWWRALPSI